MPSKFAEDNQLATRHGAEGALLRLRRGLPFLGIALETQRQVEADLGVNLEDLGGVDRIMVEDAARLEATARLFHYAALGAAEDGSLEDWERFAQRLGWITSKAFAAFKEVRTILEKDVATDYELLVKDGQD